MRDNISGWRRRRFEVVSEVPDPGRTPPGDVLVEPRILLLDALRRLTPRQRAVLVLRYFEDLSEADIALALGVSAGTVKSTAHLALRRLRGVRPRAQRTALPGDLMTDSELRDLFHSAASDADRHDPLAVDRAWRDGIRRRVGARAAVVGTVAATAGAVAGMTMLDGPAGRVAPAPAPATSSTGSPSTVSPSPEEQSGPVATYDGAPVWVSPSAAEEADLPFLEGTGLPTEIDLSVVGPPASEIARAVGVLAVVGESGELSRIIAVGADGAAYTLEADALEPVADEGGNVMPALSDESLSPDGTHLFLRQERTLVIYDFTAGAWTPMATPRWAGETAQWTDEGLWVPDEPLGRVGTVHAISGAHSTPLGKRTLDDAPRWDPGASGGEGYGPERTDGEATARSYVLAGSVDLDGGAATGLDAVAVTIEGRPRFLVHATSGGQDFLTNCAACRQEQGCPVAGWLDPGALAYRSGSRILAWTVPGGGVRRVTEITGFDPDTESYVASWAFSAR